MPVHGGNSALAKPELNTDVKMKLISKSNRQTVWSTERGVVELLQVSNDVTSTIIQPSAVL
jgi:hypothetical protein